MISRSRILGEAVLKPSRFCRGGEMGLDELNMLEAMHPGTLYSVRDLTIKTGLRVNIVLEYSRRLYAKGLIKVYRASNTRDNGGRGAMPIYVFERVKA